MKTTDDDELVALARSKPEKGFKLLMARYAETVYWHVRRLLVSHDDAQDVTQETFVRVFRSLNQYRPQIGSSFRAWLFRIATNEALRQLDKRRDGMVSLDDSPAELNNITADSYVDFSDAEAVRLQQAILTLPAKQQLAFNLRYYNELRYDEIAAITGSTPQSAKVNYHLAKEKIIRFMQLSN